MSDTRLGYVKTVDAGGNTAVLGGKGKPRLNAADPWSFNHIAVLQVDYLLVEMTTCVRLSVLATMSRDDCEVGHQMPPILSRVSKTVGFHRPLGY